MTFREPGHEGDQARDFFHHRNWGPIRTGAFSPHVDHVRASSDESLGLSDCLICIQTAIAGKRIIVDVNDAHNQGTPGERHLMAQCSQKHLSVWSYADILHKSHRLPKAGRASKLYRETFPLYPANHLAVTGVFGSSNCDLEP